MIENNHSTNSIFDVMKYCSKEFKLDTRMGPKAIIQTFTRYPVTKQDISTMKSVLEAEGLTPFNSGEFGVTSLLEKKKFLSYVDFNDDFTDYTMVEKDESMFSNKEVFEQYVEEYKIYMEKENEDRFEKKLKELGYTVREPNLYEMSNSIVGEPLKNIDNYIIDIPEINDLLAVGSYLIFYNGLARFYINTPCDRKLVFKCTGKINYEFMPMFYQTYNSKYTPDSDSYPPCEHLPRDCWFEKVDGDKYLTVNDTDAYIKVMERGIFQRYDGINDYEIMRNYLPYSFESYEDVDEYVFDHVLPLLGDNVDDSVREDIKNDFSNNSRISLSRDFF